MFFDIDCFSIFGVNIFIPNLCGGFVFIKIHEQEHILYRKNFTEKTNQKERLIIYEPLFWLLIQEMTLAVKQLVQKYLWSVNSYAKDRNELNVTAYFINRND